jgi:hypothetical protein
MLTIHTLNQGTKVWHIGETIPPIAFADIYKVTADGAELNYVQQMFRNIPMSYSKTTNVWHGDFAKFIANNLGDV